MEANGERLYLTYQPPYCFDEILRFLAHRVIPGVEHVNDNEYFRTVRLQNSDGEDLRGWIGVSNLPQENTLVVTLSNSLSEATSQVLARVSHLFDLECDPLAVYAVLDSMNSIRPDLFTMGTRLPCSFNPFEMVVRAILGQQITVKAARTLAGRFVKTFGKPLESGISSLTYTFPLPEEIVALEGPIENHLEPLGIMARRAKAIGQLAKVFVQGEIDFYHCEESQDAIIKLLTIPGIGHWTANYIAMRTMGCKDIFLETDVGIRKALAPYQSKELLQVAEQWRPWRSYATVALWNSL